MSACIALVSLENASDVLRGFGHQALIELYNVFGSRIHSFLRAKDSVVCFEQSKYGVILADVSDPMQIELAAAKLGRVFDRPFEINEQELCVTVRAAFVPCNRQLTRDDCFQRAEIGLEEARSANRFFVVCDGDAPCVKVPPHILREVEYGLEQGQFLMHYQPKVDAITHALLGAEGLIRWELPTGELRSPVQFIEPITGTRVMAPLTWFTLKSSIAQAVEWGNSVGISINISPCLLLRSDLVEQVDDAVRVFGLRPELLTLEITEEAVIQDVNRAKSALGQLREKGCKISIDDFGTGYSSLVAFRDLPVDELKIDRSFVSQMLDSPRDLGIVKAIVSLAQNLSLSVVAEGVETLQTAEELARLGVNQLQGYAFSAPVPSNIFAEFLKRENI